MHHTLHNDVKRSARPVHSQPPSRQRSDPTAKQPDAFATRAVQGHIRHPVIAREPTAIESIRSLTSTAIRHLPTVFSPAASGTKILNTSPPSQQRSTVSSYGSFVAPVTTSAAATAATVRGQSPNSGLPYPSLVPPSPTVLPNEQLPEVVHETEVISWASWDEIAGTKSRVLILGYQSGGLQVWDITSVDALQEILNIDLMSFISSEGTWVVSRAAVLPNPKRGINDEFADARPLLAIIAKEVSHQPHSGLTEVLVYSLRTHTVVRRLGALPLDDPKFGAEEASVGSDPGEDFCSAVDIQANSSFVAISTHSPPSIHILSASTLRPLHSIPPEALTALTPSSSSHNLHERPPARPTFSLSPRFIAFASPAPLPHHRGRNPGLGSTASSVASNFSPTLSAIGAGGIDLAATGAKKVGEGVWMGVKALGGLAFGSSNNQPPPPAPFSRSAPQPNSYIGASPSPPGVHGLAPMSPIPYAHRSKRSSIGAVPSGESVLNPPPSASESSGYVTILDLAPLSKGGKPGQLAHFVATPPAASVIPTHAASAVQHLSFSPNGTLLCVSDVQGHVAKVFQVRGGLKALRVAEPPQLSPQTPAARRRSSGASSTSSRGTGVAPGESPAVWHMYDLARGTTSAKVDSIVWAEDARWIGVATTRGTLHVFGINPYGGKPDDISHLDGRVRNPSSLQAWPVTVHPTIRLKATARDGFPAPIYKFLPMAVSRASSLLSPARVGRSPTEHSFGTPKYGFQDVLGFSSMTGLLTLRRCNLSLPSPAVTPADSARRPPGADFSRSLPASGVSMMMSLMPANTPETGLKASETLVASWDLKRDRTWDVVKDVVDTVKPTHIRDRKDLASVPLAQAELSTHNPRILPPSTYASHQFNFFGLEEDWHALLRRSHFEVPVRKIEVRKEVEALPQIGDAGDAFLQDMGIGASFEQPIATAIQTTLDSNAASAVMPSFPNAYKPSSWRDTIPIPHVPVRTLTEGVNEGLGRIKREINKARVPSTKVGGQEVPSLVFEDDDEAIFAQEDGDVDTRVSGGSGSTKTIETDDDHAWSEKEDEIAKVLADEAAFDDIGGPGFVLEDEHEHAAQLTAAVAPAKRGKGKKGKK